MQIVKLAVTIRLAVMFPESEFVICGGPISYGPNIPELFPRAATFADKILKGHKPADFPVEQPKKFKFIINLKAAKQFGVTIPQCTLIGRIK